MAATPISGAPLATKASSGPDPMPISIEFAAIACCTRGPPPKLITSRSMPCFLKMPAAVPTCSGTNWNVPGLRLADPHLGLRLRRLVKRNARQDAERRQALVRNIASSFVSLSSQS